MTPDEFARLVEEYEAIAMDFGVSDHQHSRDCITDAEFKRELAKVEASRARLISAWRGLEAERDALRRAGWLLSNCAFNLAQREGETLTPEYCRALNESRKAWDAALTAASDQEKGK